MQKKQKLILVAVVVAVAVVLACVYWFTRPAPQSALKTIVVEVVHKDGSAKEFTYETDAQFLIDAVGDLVEGEEGAYGLYITAVDGEVADYDVDTGWWSLTKDGEMTATGISETPIADGDHFELTYTVG